MVEELEATEVTEAEEQDWPGSGDGKNGHGPGFVLGVIVGMVAGAAGATLLAPASGEEIRHKISEEVLHETEAAPETPIARAQAALAAVRNRIRDASVEAKDAAREAEDKLRARYDELTH